MSRLNSAVKLVFWLSCTVAVLIVAQLACDLSQVARHSDELVIEARQRLIGTSQNANAVLIQVGLVTARIERASRAQEQVTTKSLAILENTDKLLTQATQTLANLDYSSTVTLYHTNEALDSVKAATQSVQKVAEAPEWQTTLRNLDQTSAEAAKATQNVAKATGDVVAVTEYYKKQLTKPASFLKKVGTYALQGAKVALRFLW